ncbi:MAG: baseplate J/gp47 family protein [Chloroflexi bacterium]|nr:baseplate J/gp47 family protein [Chloroflexota bacterium]
MAAIVYLDVDDEITSAAARLRTLADDRIAMVLPLGSRLATSRINFRLLAREAAAHRKTLEIVTGDASTRALAASAGLATHTSVAAFEGRPDTAGSPVGRGALGVGAAAGTGAAAGVGAAAEPPGAAGSPTSSGPRPPQAFGRGSDDAPTTIVPGPYSSPALAPPRAGTPVPQVGRPRPTRIGARSVAIILAVIAVLIAGVAAAYSFLPMATVTLTPAVDRLGPIQLSVTAQSGITQPDPTRLLVPAQTFSFDLDVSETFPSTGVKVDETTATGSVTFANCDPTRDVSIAQGAIVSTDSGVQFQTLQRASMKKARIFPPDCPGDTVPVQAVVPGTSGNVPTGAISRPPPGYDPSLLLVKNQTPITGGTHTETKQVAQVDVDAALAALNDKLTAAFGEAIAGAKGVPAGVSLFQETKALGVATPSVVPATLVGTVADTFQLGLTAKGTIVGADPSPVSTLADARIRSSVADGFNLVEDSVKIEVGTPLVTGSTITFPVTATAIATRELDVSVLRDRIRGLGLPQARTVLGAYGTVTIVVWPDWVTTIPTNDARLSFTIKAPVLPSAAPGASPRASAGRSSSPAPATGAP